MKPLLYYHTIRHLKPVQIKDRIVRRLRRPSVRRFDTLALRGQTRPWVDSPAKPNSYLGGNTFRFLNHSGSVESREDWNSPSRAKLWLYHLHYFDYLLQADVRRDGVRWLDRWIEQNPPGEGDGWEPYPISRRVVNWVKYHLQHEPLQAHQLSHLALQTDYLSQSIEYHLQANHLLANAKALFFVGLFGEGVFPDIWKKKGQEILLAQLDEQILPDGAHFERSPMYHSIILEDFLDIVNLCGVYEAALDEADVRMVERIRCYIPRMLAWLQALSHADGQIAFFNDAATGMGQPFGTLKDYAQAVLGTSLHLPPCAQCRYFRDSGFIRVEQGSLILLADVGSVGPAYQPGHSHAGTLSFEVSLRAERLVVNSGTSGYEDNKDRAYLRSGAAHNTIRVDGQDSTELWRSHRVAKRSKVTGVNIESSGKGVVIRADQDGFCRLPGVGRHQRQFQINRKEITIIDRIEGKGLHRINLFWHFAPTILLVFSDEGILMTKDECRMGWLEWSDGCDVTIQPSVYWYEFGGSVPKLTAVVEWSGRLPYQISTRLVLED